jgi:hypothetical protein
MKLLDFFKSFPDEEKCRLHFKKLREHEGVMCKGCMGLDHWWLPSKRLYECKGCGRRMSLRSGTVMENSKLPYLYWYVAMHLMTATKQPISAKELHNQLGHKYYQPIFEMMHKLRKAMGNRDANYQLEGQIEVDEAFFGVNTKLAEGERLKRGAGSQRKAKVLVMAESEAVREPKKGRKRYRCGHFKMLALPDLAADTIGDEVKVAIGEEAHLRADDSSSHVGLQGCAKSVEIRAMPGEDGARLLPWVHTAISNAKAAILGTYHGVSRDYLQNYLNEFCYKLNRRYFGHHMFERLAVAATYHWKT